MFSTRRNASTWPSRTLRPSTGTFGIIGRYGSRPFLRWSTEGRHDDAGSRVPPARLTIWTFVEVGLAIQDGHVDKVRGVATRISDPHLEYVGGADRRSRLGYPIRLIRVCGWKCPLRIESQRGQVWDLRLRIGGVPNSRGNAGLEFGGVD